MTRTTVHLVRHGEVHNPDKVLYGRLPGYVLSDAGHDMAAAAARALRGREVVHIVTSPLERARQTAAPIEAEFGRAAVADDRLIESENRFQGRPVTGPSSFLDPKVWRLLWNPFRPSWGEPYAAVAQRMLAAVEDARDAGRGHEVVCVSHQLPIVVLRRCVERRRLWHRPDRRLCSLASITSFVYDDDRLVALSYAEPAGPAGRKKAPPGA